jgi:4-hydroxybenzoate polyprenyltransferase
MDTLIKQVIRMSNNIYSGLIALLISWIVSPFNPLGIVCALIVFFYTAGGNTLNEFYDKKTDIPRNMVLKYSLFFFATGSALLMFLPVPAVLLALFVMMLLLFYDVNFIYVKNHLNLKNIVVALCTAFVPIFVVLSVDKNEFLPQSIIVAIIFFGFQFWRERWKDIDEKEAMKYSKKMRK